MSLDVIYVSIVYKNFGWIQSYLMVARVCVCPRQSLRRKTYI